LNEAKILQEAIVQLAIDLITRNKIKLTLSLRVGIINDAPLITTPQPLYQLAHIVLNLLKKNTKPLILAILNDQKKIISYSRNTFRA